MATISFPFTFSPLYRAAAVLFGVTPRTALVAVGEGRLDARFGPWRLRTELDNIVDAELTGPYALWRTVGPAHLSFADHGLTMATNPDRGVCIRFAQPVPGLEPTGRLRHPGLTATVADCPGLLEALLPHRS